MKENIIRLIVIVLGMSLFTCSNQDTELFGDKPSIYFDTGVDSTLFSFAGTLEPTATVNLKVRISGTAVNKDRLFKVSLNKDLTTAKEGVHFVEIPELHTVPAGEYEAYVPITLKDGDSFLYDNYLDIVLKIESSDDFEPGVFDKLEHKLSFSEILKKPSYWSACKYYYGVYSRVKHKVYIDLFEEDFPEKYYTRPGVKPIGFLNDMGKVHAYSATLSGYFKDNYPVYDENGDIIAPW